MKSSPEPTWDIAKLFPAQGLWAEEDYLLLPGNYLVEFADGKVEVLSMPSERHQSIVHYFSLLLTAFVLERSLGKVLTAPFRLKLRSGKFREPDLLFLLTQNFHQRHEQYWDGADLVVEVVSPDDPERDLVVKRHEYAEAGIREYWLVNPLDETITVLTLLDTASLYQEHGVFVSGQVADSVLLRGFKVEVNKVFAV